ncbi:mucin-5AC-like protein [Arabidopsis thaliana]|uniref:Mucin-5AC-like protein n=1 Tax=Arabidopsis thaliana TaxID=3702 RepID=A0A1I9LNE6_ARATH|nr:mucin-5AC-like protein [Arabidopsis thaliana]ANM64104.1 mucin-5AC-like protein [Arabidopsis thaliana]|eukprot:NP_001326154.1 mucin-5AC-like protein [Arabidopsis thaliana]
MSDRSLKKSLPGKSNRQADENLDLFSVNRGTSLDVLIKPGRHSFQQAKVAKHGPDDDNNHNIHANEPLYTIAEVPLGDLSRLVLEARNTTSKLQSITTTRVPLRSESDPSSRPTRSGSTIRPSNIPTIRSSSVPKKTTTTQIQASASVSSPKRTVSRSLTPSSRKTPSPTSTPSRISTTTSTTPSFKTAGDAQRSRSLTPRAKPQIAANASSRTNVRSSSVTSRPDRSTTVSATPRTPPRLKETVTLAFGRPVGHVNSPKRNTSPDVTRTRPKGRSASPSLIPTFSGTSHTTTTPKSIKPSATVADSTRPGRKLSRASVQMAINHLVITFSCHYLIIAKYFCHL